MKNLTECLIALGLIIIALVGLSILSLLFIFCMLSPFFVVYLIDVGEILLAIICATVSIPLSIFIIWLIQNCDDLGDFDELVEKTKTLLK